MEQHLKKDLKQQKADKDILITLSEFRIRKKQYNQQKFKSYGKR